jgi:hypothetical protein
MRRTRLDPHGEEARAPEQGERQLGGCQWCRRRTISNQEARGVMS